MPFQNTYLNQVRQKNKKLFSLIVVCIALTLITNLSKNEITPFYLWSMYSAKTPYTDTFEIYTFEYNDGKVFNSPHTWMDHKRMMFYYTIDEYQGIIDNGGTEADKTKAATILNKMHTGSLGLTKIFNTKSDIGNYPLWLKRYMEANTGIKMDSVKVYRRWVKFNNEGKVYPVKSELVLKA